MLYSEPIPHLQPLSGLLIRPHLDNCVVALLHGRTLLRVLSRGCVALARFSGVRETSFALEGFPQALSIPCDAFRDVWTIVVMLC